MCVLMKFVRLNVFIDVVVRLCMCGDQRTISLNPFSPSTIAVSGMELRQKSRLNSKCLYHKNQLTGSQFHCLCVQFVCVCICGGHRSVLPTPWIHIKMWIDFNGDWKWPGISRLPCSLRHALWTRDTLWFFMSQIDKVFVELWPHSVCLLCAVSNRGHEALKLYIFMFIDKQNEIWNTFKGTK